MNRTLIITGGHIDIPFAREYLSENEYENIIAVDGGLTAADELGLMPDYIVGDFDTVNQDTLKKYEDNENTFIKKFNPEKDFTDTYLALETAIEINSFHIDMLGGTGSRLDHSIANIQMLYKALKEGIEAVIVNENNRIRLVGGKRRIYEAKKDKRYKYISLIPMTEKVSGISTSGMKYELNDFEMQLLKNTSLGVSNEIMADKAVIKMEEGILIVIESCDD